MASKVAAAYIELAASLNKLSSDFTKAGEMHRAYGAQAAAIQAADAGKKAQADEAASGKTLNSQKSLYKRALLAARGFRSELRVIHAMQNIAMGAFNASAKLIQFAKSTEFAQSKMLGMGQKSVMNELFIAMLPAIESLIVTFEKLRQVIYQNREVISQIGMVAANGLGMMVKVLDSALKIWDYLPKSVQKTLLTFAAFAVPVGVVIAKLLMFAPVIVMVTKFGAAVLAVTNPLNIILQTTLAFGAALLHAANSDKWGGRMAAAFAKISATVMYVKDSIMDAMVRVWAIIQPYWEQFVEFAVRKFEMISAWLESNKDTWHEWVGLISEIVGNTVATLISVWNTFWDFVDWSLSSLAEMSGVTWEGIGSAVTSVLNWMSLATSNFGLSAKIAWKAIQLAASVAWDSVLTYFQTMAAKVGAGLTSLAAGAVAAMRNVKAALTGGDMMDVGRVMKKVYDDVFKDLAPSELMSGRSKKLLEELKGLNRELNDGRDKQRDLTEKQVKDAQEERNKIDRKHKETGAPPPAIAVKFETLGLKDLYKKIQESMTGVSMQGLAERQAKAAEENVNVGRRQEELLKKIADKKDEGAKAG